MRLAIIYNKNSRVAMGERCAGVLARYNCCFEIQQFDLAEVKSLKNVYDFYIRFDDGDYTATIPRHLRPIAWWLSDTHLKKPYQKILSQINQYDFIFTAQQNAVLDLQLKTGIKNIFWLPWAADSPSNDLWFRNDDEREWDVCFIGTQGKYSLRKVLIETIRSNYPNSFIGAVPYVDLQKYYSKSRIVINYPIKNDINARFFEAMGSGAMLMSFPVVNNGLESLFTVNKEFVLVEEFVDEICPKIDYYLDHVDERMRIAKSGFDCVNKFHTYQQRIDQLLRTIGLC